MKTKVNRKEIKATVKNAISEVVQLLNVEAPSRKTKKAIKKASVAVAELLKKDLKKQFRSSENRQKKNGSRVSKAEVNSKPIEIY
jgi:hypothetical protein